MRGMGLRKEECVRVKKAVGGGELHLGEEARMRRRNVFDRAGEGLC